MKLEILEDPAIEETQIVIHCRQIDETVQRVAAALRAIEHKLVGEREGRTFVLDPREVFYAESVDKRTFLYTARDVYQTPLRLHEVEERYASDGFFRAGKSVVLNLGRVRMLSPMLGGRIEVELENGEKQMVSRQYVPLLRQKLGL